jgi:hypothetical protein
MLWLWKRIYDVWVGVENVPWHWRTWISKAKSDQQHFEARTGYGT